MSVEDQKPVGHQQNSSLQKLKGSLHHYDQPFLPLLVPRTGKPCCFKD